MPKTSRAEIAVIGLGAMGSAILYQLARRGIGAVGIDRFAPPHAQGSSHGETRITRQAVGEGADYVPFVVNSHEIWRELEAETGETLLVSCGALIMAPGSRPSSHHGKPDFVKRSVATAERFAIPHEALDTAEIARRFPQFAGLEDEVGYYEPGAGYVFPERCIAAQLRRAAELGAAIRTNTEVVAIEEGSAGVRIATTGGEILCDRAVVAAGAWATPLLGAPFDQLLQVNRQVLHWFALEDDAPAASDAPVFIWMHGATDVDYFYGFPPLPGDKRLKVATEQYEETTTADAVDRTVSPAESEAMFRDHVRGRLAGVSGRAVGTAACVYTVTPDRGFIIDEHPALGRVTVVSACSGHGFKHSAGIGKAVAERLTRGESAVDLAPFSLSRFTEARSAAVA